MNNEGFIALGLGALVAGCGIALGRASKQGQANQAAIDRASRAAVDEYVRSHPIHISDETLAGAVDRSVDSRVRSYVDRVQTDISRVTRDTIQKKVNEVYSREEKDISERFAQEVSSKLWNLKKEDIRDKIEERALELIDDKVEHFLDDADIDNAIDEEVDKAVTRVVHDEVSRRAFWRR